MENKKNGNIVILILAMIIVALVAYIVFLQNRESNQEVAQNEMKRNDAMVIENEIDTAEKNVVKNEVSTKEVKEADLTNEELEQFDEFLSMNGWITTSYTKVKEADLGEVMYNLANSSEEIQREYEKLFLESGETLDIEAGKLTTEEVKKMIEENTGENVKDLKTMESRFEYNQEKDAYYVAHGDTNLFEVKCEKGYRTSDNKYIINYEELHASEKRNGTVILKKVDDKYLFVSNEIK